MMTRTTQSHQAGHIRPAGHMFETPARAFSKLSPPSIFSILFPHLQKSLTIISIWKELCVSSFLVKLQYTNVV